MELETENHFRNGEINESPNDVIARSNKRSRCQSRVNAIFV